MMRRKSERLFVACLSVVIGLAGCSEWESSGDDSAWNDAYNWLDFSGIYADAASGVLVRDGVSATSSLLASGEAAGTGNGTSTSFSGTLVNGGVVPGSVLIAAGAFGFVDDGAGMLTSPDIFAATVTETAVAGGGSLNAGIVSGAPVVPGSVTISAAGLIDPVVDNNFDGTSDGGDTDGVLQNALAPSATGTFIYETGAWSLTETTPIPGGTLITITYQQASTDAGVSGSIAYESGGWTINLQGTALPAGTPITATYRYTQPTTSAGVTANTGTPIYTFNVLQTGDRLRIIDSNGNEFQGRLFDVNSSAGNLTDIPTAGDEDNPQVGDYVGSFYAEGTANGVFVTLDGSFAGSILQDERQNTLFDRRMSGSWRESGGKAGVFLGSTDPVTTQ